MAGGSSDYIPTNRTPEDVRKRLKQAEKVTLGSTFNVELSNLLQELLAGANDRDTDLVGDRLETIRSFVGDDFESVVDVRFGGSVAKHTYVDGLSDIDTLLILKKDAVAGDAPKDVIAHVASLVKNRIGQDPNVVSVEPGSMAVTVTYADGMELQLLPALTRPDGRVQVASSDGSEWSAIRPRAFQEKLTERNQACNGRLVPVIKLAKTVLANLPPAQQLTGYHVESLAIAAFKNYAGEKTTHEMLVQFFAKAKELVASPIKDSTGQSVNVDDYLGGPASEARKRRKFMLERIEKRMRNANVMGSISVWQSILGLDDQ